MPSRIDLHTHTTASDGTLTPVELFDKAAGLDMQVLALSDHDSTAGYDALVPLQSTHPTLRLIPAIELSAGGEFACHLLGYFINTSDKAFQNHLSLLREKRVERLQIMARQLDRLGFPVEWSRVVALAHGGSLGRPHLADAMMEKGYVKSRQEAFDRFLKRDGPAYTSESEPAAQDSIGSIRKAGGIPVLAHPSYYTSESLLKNLVQAGLMGIEAYYPEHSRSLTQHYIEFARDLGLVVTGGSDFHGPGTGRSALGSVTVPEAVVESLEKLKNSL